MINQENLEVNHDVHDLLFICDSLFKEYDSPELNLRVLRIYFYATTFDRITKDRAAKFVDMLSAIGGTMGLLTGFSIISGVEIVYFGIKIIFKMLQDRCNKKQMKHIA